MPSVTPAPNPRCRSKRRAPRSTTPTPPFIETSIRWGLGPMLGPMLVTNSFPSRTAQSSDRGALPPITSRAWGSVCPPTMAVPGLGPMDGVARPSSSHSASSSPLPWLPTTTAAPARASGLGLGSTSLRQSSRPSVQRECAHRVLHRLGDDQQPPAGVHHQARGVGGRGEGAEHGAGRAVEDPQLGRPGVRDGQTRRLRPARSRPRAPRARRRRGSARPPPSPGRRGPACPWSSSWPTARPPARTSSV